MTKSGTTPNFTTGQSTARPNWHATWFSVAICVATRSLCVRDKVGAVIVDTNNRIVATGYNGPPSGFVLPYDNAPCHEWCPRATASDLLQDYSDCPSLH